MKKSVLVLLTLIIIVGFSVPPKDNDKMIYIFPDDVEVALNNYIERLKKVNEDLKFELTLYREDDKAYRVFVNNYEESKRSLINSVNVKWSELTNRYVIINDTEYPLLFDYDYLFSTKDPINIGEFGNRDGYILRIMSLNDGFSVKFDKQGLIDD